MSASNTTIVNETEASAQQTANVVRLRPPTLTAERAILKYLEIRARRDALKKEHAKALAPFDAALETLEGWLLADLNAAGLQSMRAKAGGTAYKSLQTSATVEDWPAVLHYIRAREAWDLLEARVSKLAVFAVIEDTKEPIPGVKTSAEYVVNVRKS